ncbi:hypothetical protein JCM18920_2023 [Cutibacterium acnes JCM 18920]|nr:hypothetical protein JCM18920_2023 [Cutibacterium acnes JCM 18920]
MVRCEDLQRCVLPMSNSVVSWPMVQDWNHDRCFSLVPSGGRASREDGGVADAVAAAVKVVRDSGLPNHTSSMFTEIEGSWDEVMDVVKRATEAVAQYGTRVSLVLKADIRPGRTGEMTAKLERLQGELDKQHN